MQNSRKSRNNTAFLLLVKESGKREYLLNVLICSMIK